MKLKNHKLNQHSLPVPGASGVDMAKSKNHTTHNQSWKWNQNGIKKPWSQRYKSLKKVDPKFPRNMCPAKKHMEKGLKKMQTNNAKAMSACAEVIKALIRSKKVKPKIPKGSIRKLSQLAYITHPKLGKHTRVYIAKGLMRLCQPKSKAKVQTRPRMQLQLCFQLRLRLWLPKVARPSWRLQSRSVCQCEDRRNSVSLGLLSVLGWCPPILFVQKTWCKICQKSNHNLETLYVLFMSF